MKSEVRRYGYCKAKSRTVRFNVFSCTAQENICSMMWLLVVISLILFLVCARADSGQHPCASLAADGLLIDSMPSSTCLTGVVNRTTLYNRSDTGISLDDNIIDILLPFPFRWFDMLHNGSVFVGSNSYVTFGGSKMLFGDFSVFDPPFPSIFISALDMTMQVLSVGWVPQGWLVRYEGAPLNSNFNDDVDPGTGKFLNSSPIVWELLFFRAGGLRLCTGVLNGGDSLSGAISAVSHQMSSKFAHTFTLQPNFMYTFETTCAAVNRVSLSAPIASISGVQLNTMLFLSLKNVSDVSSLTITLKGAGFSCPSESAVALISSSQLFSTFGTASIIAGNSSSPVLVVSGIDTLIKGSTILAFSLHGVTTPSQPQEAFTDLAFALHDGSGKFVTGSSNVHMGAISAPIPLFETPSLELSVPVIKQTQSELRIIVSPRPQHIIFHRYAPTALVITVTGIGWWFDHASLTAFLGWNPVASSIVMFENKASVIRVDFDPANARVISSVTNLILKVSPIHTPQLIQNSVSNIKCAILNDRGSILAAGNSGFLGTIVASTMGSFSPSVSFATPLKSLPDAVLNVKLAPTFRRNFQIVQHLILPVSSLIILITMSGLGFTCADNTPVTFILPFSANGLASVDSVNPMLPVLTVTVLAGKFESEWPIWFQVFPVSTPSFEQPLFGNITSAIYSDDGNGNGINTLISASVSGTMDPVVSGMGPNQPEIQHTYINGTGILFVSFTPSALLSANSRLIVTLTGVGLSCPDFTAVRFSSPVFDSKGSASFINEPLSSVLVVIFVEAISAGVNVSFSVSPVFSSFSSSSKLANVHACIINPNDNILMASASGLFAAEVSSNLTVKDYIISAINGTILLPAELLAGRANCNNVINETMPRRAWGFTVFLKSSGNETVIDCSSTNMRCLIVQRSSLSITSVTFKGGSSPKFVHFNTVMSIRALYDTMKGRTQETEYSTPLQSPGSSSSESQRVFEETNHSYYLAALDQESIFGDNLQSTSRIGRNQNSRHIHIVKHRKLLHLSRTLSHMFTPELEGCGGCLLVDAADYNVSLVGVTFLGCNAVYGGGGFFNVSSFNATRGLGSNNLAQQGGGLFVLSTADTTVRSFVFVNNTVASFLPSKYEVNSESSFGKFSLLPDPSAAAGGGAWFQMLNVAENCAFLDNTAIAVSTSDTAWTNNAMSGAHALGSGMFVLEIRHLIMKSEIQSALLAHLVFDRSQQLCAGWCVSGGAIFVGVTDGDVKMERLVFNKVVSNAVASRLTAYQCQALDVCIGPSVVLGSCIIIADMSSNAMLNLRDIHAKNISILATGSIFGGYISFLQKLSNSVMFNISASNTVLIAMGSYQNAIYGLIGANFMFNSSISLISTRNLSMTCSGLGDRGVVYSRGIYGGVLYLKASAQMRILQYETANTQLKSSSGIYGGVVYIGDALGTVVEGMLSVNLSLTILNPGIGANCYGGVFYFGRSRDTKVSKCATDDLQMHCSSAANRSTCQVRGGVLFIRFNSHSDIFSDFSGHKLLLSCESTECFTSGGFIDMNDVNNISIHQLSLKNCSVTCSGASCKAWGGALSMHGNTKISTISGLTLDNTSATCNGAGCHCLGGLLFAESISKPVSQTGFSCYNFNTAFSHFRSNLASAACSGENCFVLGGVAYFEKASCLLLRNFVAMYSKISSNGTNTKAAGTILGVGASYNSLLSNIQSFQSMLSCHGNYSQALGGAVSILSGNMLLNNSFFSRSTVQCNGYRCIAIGGFLSVVSTLIYNSDYETQISVDLCLFIDGNVACSGLACSASGGALVVAKSYRSSIWLDTSAPKFSESSPPQIYIMMRSCLFSKNHVSSYSRGASVGGGALYVRSSVAIIFNCTFEENFIVSSDLVAFAGGGAVQIVSPNSQVTVRDCSFSFNDASSLGQGGALLVAYGAVFVGSNITIRNNRASKGGGILVDASEVYLSNTKIQSNFAASSGGGLFCSSNQANGFYGMQGLNGSSTINLKNVSFHSNVIINPVDLGVGADLFVMGSVFFAADNASGVSMSGNYDRDVTATIVSVITDSPHIYLKTTCLFGTMLRIAPTSLSNLISKSEPPSFASMTFSKCFPACLEVPLYESYVAASGFLASCTPCPRGTYTFRASNSTSDIISSFCNECPFGAHCLGGNKVITQESYWGWEISETALPKEFLILPEGYGCKQGDCQGINSCGGNRNSVLCGGCNQGFSAAFFTTDCVSDDECATWKLWVLLCFAFAYSFVYSIFLRYNVNVQPQNLPNAKSAEKIQRRSIAETKHESRSSAFYVLMWYYQLVGLLLAMPNPLQFLESTSVLVNIIGLCFGTSPVSQVFELPSLVFCTARGSAPDDILLANVLFYVIWAVIMIGLSFERVWLHVFHFVHKILDSAPTYWQNYENACEVMALWGSVGKVLAVFLALKWTVQKVVTTGFTEGLRRLPEAVKRQVKSALLRLRNISCKNCASSSQSTLRSQSPAVYPGEVRGRAWIDFGVTMYSALLSLMIQGTTCVTVSGYQMEGVALPELRWFYDGRIVCFSESGERSGRWQIAALIAVLVLAVIPLALAIYMHRAMKKPKLLQNVFESSALPAYLEQFNSENKHWFTVLFYERIALSFIIFYTLGLNAPFIRGILSWLVCLIILALDFEFKPYADRDLQLLSSRCCVLLITLSSVLLRSQTLLSSARAINFLPSNPDENAKNMSLDVLVTLWITMTCLISPLILVFKPFSSILTFCSLINAYLMQVCKGKKVTDQQNLDQKSPNCGELTAPLGFKTTSGHDRPQSHHEEDGVQPVSATNVHQDQDCSATDHYQLDAQVHNTSQARTIACSAAQFWTDFAVREIIAPDEAKLTSIRFPKRATLPQDLWKSDALRQLENNHSL